MKKKSAFYLIAAIVITIFIFILSWSDNNSFSGNHLQAAEAQMAFPGDSIAQSGSSNPLPETAAAPVKAFDIGERLVFKIRWKFIRAGTAEMRVVSLTDLGDRAVYHIQTTARSIPSFDWIYKVRDVVNTFVDAEQLYPLRFEKRLREGSYKTDLFVDYFHEDSLARINSIRFNDDMSIRKMENYDVRIPPYVFDVLSSFYYVRTNQLEVGQSIYLSNHEKKKIYDLEVKVHKRENIEVEAGKFRCLKVEPLLQGEGIFKQKGGLTVWLTDDEFKIPVQMTSKVLVGHITTELIQIDGIDRKIPAQLN